MIHYVFGVFCFQAGPPQQSRSTGALYRETVQVHGNVFICLLDFNLYGFVSRTVHETL